MIHPLAKDWSDVFFETVAIHRKVGEILPLYNALICHASAVSLKENGYIFLAKSGTGKSTHTRLWREYFGDRAVMVNDDKPLLHIADTVTAYGTPYNGKHRLGTNTSVPLKAICILTRSADNHIEPISFEQAYKMLLQQVYRPADSILMMKTLTLIDRLGDSVKFYQLGCNMDISAAQVAFEGMQ
jgi:hypothetical protein